MRRFAQRLAALATGAALVAAGAGCGASDPSGAEEGGEQAAAKAPKELTIGVSNLGLSFPFPASIGRGIQDEAKKLGVEIVQLDAKGKTSKQANDMQDLIAREIGRAHV